MRRGLIIIAVIMVFASGSAGLAQERAPKASSSSDGGNMMWTAMVGAGFLHEHMNYMIRQMSGMTRMMSEMMTSGKIDEKKMKTMAEMMAEMSNMMKEIPAVQAMMDKRPDTAMKDMSKMTKTMAAMMNNMADMMSGMQK